MRDYLGVGPDHLHIPRKFQSKPDPELEGEELLMAVARDSMYVLELANILRTGLEESVKRVTQTIMKQQRVTDIMSTFTTPSNMAEILKN